MRRTYRYCWPEGRAECWQFVLNVRRAGKMKPHKTPAVRNKVNASGATLITSSPSNSETVTCWLLSNSYPVLSLL